MAADGKYPGTDPQRSEDRGGDDASPAPSEADSAAAGADRDGHGQTEPPFSSAFDERATLVDRDDDSSIGSASLTPFADSDYADDFPDVPDVGDETGRDKPDPGFAAFPDGLDDPLADWPAPDADLDSLPEMRERAVAGDGPGEPTRDDGLADRSLAGEAADTAGPGSFQEIPEDPAPGMLTDDLPEAAFFDDPVEADARETESAAPPREAAHDTNDVDREEPEPAAMTESLATFDDGFDDGWTSGLDDGLEDELDEGMARSLETEDTTEDPPGALDAPLPTVTELPDPPDIETVDEDAYGVVDDLPSRADHDDRPAGTTDGSATADGADDDAFIDDFLNDLDEPDEADLRENPVEPGRDVVAAFVDEADGSADSLSGGESMIGGGSASVVHYGADILDANDGQADPPAMDERGEERVTAAAGDDDPGLPWGMIAVVAVALLLLAAGGFGVVQQRSSLKAEIRDLQAQLATAVAPEEAAAGRERQRQIELENEALNAELTALLAENGALSEQLASLEARLEEQLAEQENAAREAEAAAAAAVQRATQSPQQARSEETSAPAADSSGWFVNFGSYAQENIARRWADRLDVSDGRVVIQEARASGRTLYRVRVVGLKTQDTAEAVARTLERQHQLPRLWVGRSDP